MNTTRKRILQPCLLHSSLFCRGHRTLYLSNRERKYDAPTLIEKEKSTGLPVNEYRERGMEKEQARYKRNLDAELRLQVQNISEGSFVYVRRDHTPRMESQHKLAPVADGPFEVVGADEHEVVVKKVENAERVSRDRVELAPKPVEPVTQALAASLTHSVRHLWC